MDIEGEHLNQKLKNAAYDQLCQLGNPEMPKNFHQRVSAAVVELLRALNNRQISISESFAKIRDFATNEYLRIYPFDD